MKLFSNFLLLYLYQFSSTTDSPLYYSHSSTLFLLFSFSNERMFSRPNYCSAYFQNWTVHMCFKRLNLFKPTIFLSLIELRQRYGLHFPNYPIILNDLTRWTRVEKRNACPTGISFFNFSVYSTVRFSLLL